MIATLTLDDFVPTLEQQWTVDVQQNLHFDWVLISATPLGKTTTYAGARQAFSLIWRGAPQPILPQAIYRLRHPAFSEPLEIFVVPIGAEPTHAGMRYEAVFT